MRTILRKALLSRYDVDIDNGSKLYASNIHSFIIETGDYTFRFVADSEVTRKYDIARMMWADDVRLFRDTIAEPIPSKTGQLIENIKMGKWSFSCSMYNTGSKGHIISRDEIRPMFLIAAGDMLGMIHNVSMDQSKNGMKFKLPDVFYYFEELKSKVWNMLNPRLQVKLDQYFEEARQIPQTEETYGVCYMDYCIDSIMVDTNNIHLFDFNQCSYAGYMYDVAAFFLSVIRINYLPNRSARDVVQNNLIPWFRIGYSINKPCDAHTFDNIEVFMRLRLAILLMSFVEQASTSEEENSDRIEHIRKISAVLAEDDLYEGFDKHIRIGS